MRLFSLDLVGRYALAGAQVPHTGFEASCAGDGFLILDPAGGHPTVTSVPLPTAGQLRVDATKAQTSLSQMNNYVFGVRLDPTRSGTSDTLFVLDGVEASAFVLPLPTTASGFSNAVVQQVPQANWLQVQGIDKTAGDQGLVLFDLDQQTATNLFVPADYTTVGFLDDGATICCLTTRKLVARALKAGGSSMVVYNLATGDLTVVPSPAGVTSVGPPPGATTAAGRVFSNARANTVSAVAYAGQKQAGIIIIRIP